MAKVIFINAVEKKVEERVIADVLSGTQALVGGYVQMVPFVKGLNRSSLMVDEEGLCKGYDYGFTLDGHQFVGNGVVGTFAKSDTKATLALVQSRVSWL
jgi:hypothetical protein